jgi:hypothetical protein
MFDFKTDLEASKTMAKKQVAEVVLKRIFPNSPVIWNVSEGNDSGIDLIVEDYAIDVKYRKSDCQKYGDDDICLEVYSVVEKKKIGWTLDDTKSTDWVLWIWGDTQRHEFLPFQELKQAFKMHGKKWLKKYGEQIQVNNGYKSLSVYVPRNEVHSAIEALYYQEEQNENN